MPSPQTPADGDGRRFLTLADVAEILATSVAQVRSLVQSGELRYIQIGGRQQYRIETVELENYIQRMYAASDAKSTDAQPDAEPDAQPGPTGSATADPRGPRKA